MSNIVPLRRPASGPTEAEIEQLARKLYDDEHVASQHRYGVLRHDLWGSWDDLPEAGKANWRRRAMLSTGQ